MLSNLSKKREWTSDEGAARWMRLAMQDLKRPIDYLNPHGTGAAVSDAREIEAVRAVFGDDIPLISSTKALIDHFLGAAGAPFDLCPLCHFVTAPP